MSFIPFSLEVNPRQKRSQRETRAQLVSRISMKPCLYVWLQLLCENAIYFFFLNRSFVEIFKLQHGMAS